MIERKRTTDAGLRGTPPMMSQSAWLAARFDDDAFAWDSMPQHHRDAALRLVRRAERQRRRARLVALLVSLCLALAVIGVAYWMLFLRG